MHGNRGSTSLRKRRRTEDPMREFDRLPASLRSWLAGAMLPWRPRSVRQAFDRAMAQTADETRALELLDQLQQRLVAQDARRIWGSDHPCATLDRAL